MPSILSAKPTELRLSMAPSPSPTSPSNQAAAIIGTFITVKMAQANRFCCAPPAQAGTRQKGRSLSVWNPAAPFASRPASSTGMVRRPIPGLATSPSSRLEKESATNGSSRLLMKSTTSYRRTESECLETFVRQGTRFVNSEGLTRVRPKLFWFLGSSLVLRDHYRVPRSQTREGRRRGLRLCLRSSH